MELQSSEGLTRQERSKSKMSDSHSWRVGAGCLQEDLVLHHVDVSIGHLEHLLYTAVAFSQNKWGESKAEMAVCLMT